MQYKFFGIPAADAAQAEAELNRFVRGHRVITVHRELVREAGTAYWAFCLEYLEGAGSVGSPIRRLRVKGHTPGVRNGASASILSPSLVTPAIRWACYRPRP